jgi:molybdopterin biosynthesis enzyme
VRVTLERTAEGVLAHPAGNQSSGVLTSLIRGQGLAVIPLESEGVEAGTVLDVQVLDTTFFDGTDRGF